MCKLPEPHQPSKPTPIITCRACGGHFHTDGSAAVCPTCRTWHGIGKRLAEAGEMLKGVGETGEAAP